MAAQDKRKCTLVVNRDGFSVKLTCEADVAKMLSSTSTDPSVKELLIDGLIRQQYPDPPMPSSQAGATKSENKASQSTSHSSCETPSDSDASSVHKNTPSTSLDLGKVHNWTEKQEDMLVHLRHERHDDFQRVKNHMLLWKEIVCELNQSLNCAISVQQAINKYNNLKKRWKEVVDSKSGSEAKYFRQREAFDQMYGTKISNNPECTIDSGNLDSNNNVVEDVTSEGEAKSETLVKKGKGKKISRKRSKTDELVQFMETNQQELSKQMAEFHEQKMQRLDRLLNLYEMDIKTRDKDKN